MIYLDTHVVVWLYAGRVDLLPPGVRAQINAHELLISPAVGLELQYLHEIGRTRRAAEAVVAALEVEIGLEVCDLPFQDVVRVAWGESWTRDPFDRIIVSQAKLRGTALLSRDTDVRAHYPETVWDDSPEPGT